MADPGSTTQRRATAGFRCSVRRSSPPSPTSIPATWPPMSAPAPSSASCWCGSSSWRTSWRGWSSTCRPSSASSPAARSRRPSPTTPARRTRIAYWLQAELVAMATDLAEVVGGAIALYLLFDLPCSLSAASSPAWSRCCCWRSRTGAANGCSSGSSAGCCSSSRSASSRACSSSRRRRPRWRPVCYRDSMARRASCWPPRCSARR